MEKSEVYDYLAKIYLDKQPAPVCKGQTKLYIPWKKYSFFLIVLAIAVPAAYLMIAAMQKVHTAARNSLYLSTGNELIKIKFDFTDSELKKQGYTITFSDLEAQNFKYLRLRLRRLKKYGALNLRIEMENTLRENSSYYLTDIANKWQAYTIPLAEFKEITQWDALRRISFIVEEWNAENKDDCIYIDEIRFAQEKGEG